MRIDSPLAFGFRDKAGPALWAWGEKIPTGDSPVTLQFRDFHFPHPRKGRLWDSFPLQASWSLAHSEEREFPQEPTKELPLEEGADFPPKEGWDLLCHKIESHLAAGSLQKAVPARSRVYSLSPKVAARLRQEILPRLFSGPSKGAFRFFLKSGNSWFFGATPEMLFRLQGKKLLVPAIAGTLAFHSETDTSAMEAELLANPKERNEHALVVNGIKERLTALGLQPEAPSEPVVMKLRSLLHLYTPITAEGEVSSEKLLSLHPTAAVGGTPQLTAQEFLRENEPIDRGLFASPLLFRFPKLDICLVAIRSALLVGDQLHFFAGAGYVKGSSPIAEWAETRKKMDSLKLLLEEERV